MARPEAIADDEALTFSIPEAGRKVGLGRNASYAAAKRGELPVVWYGHLGRVPKTALAKQLEQAWTRNAEPPQRKRSPPQKQPPTPA